MNLRETGRQRATAATLGLSAAAVVGVVAVGTLAHHDTVASRASVSTTSAGQSGGQASSQSSNVTVPSVSGSGQAPAATSSGS